MQVLAMQSSMEIALGENTNQADYYHAAGECMSTQTHAMYRLSGLLFSRIEGRSLVAGDTVFKRRRPG